jgi:carboxymethylenebutenolidase
MCDEHSVEDQTRYLAAAALSRRQFAALTGVAGLALLLPVAANAAEIAGRDVTITTPDGQADAYFAAPKTGKHPGVLMWPDIMGLRPAFRQMADRLARSGYAVLVVNQFYRSTKAPFLAPGQQYDDPAARAIIAPLLKALSDDGTVRDATAFITFIDAQPETDTKRGMATAGYCMGGPMMMRTAATRPDRIRAGASCHGASLVTDKPDSPHLLVPQLKGHYLFAIAESDNQRSPTDKDALRKAFADAHVPAEIEVYVGTAHGWCPPDTKVYNPVQAERAWSRMLATFQQAL